MCYNGTFRFKKLDDSFWNGETFRFADYMYTLFYLGSDVFCLIYTIPYNKRTYYNTPLNKRTYNIISFSFQ